MAAQASRKSKRPDGRPARGRYWSTHRLRINKVRRIVRSSGMTPSDARLLWESQRKGRMKR